MIRIGMMDLDTGHGPAFTKALNNMDDVRVTAVFDHGDVRSASDVKAFCNLHDCFLADSVEELATRVDGVMVLGVDWNQRFARARALIHRHVPIFICKPAVGSVRDIDGLIKMQQQNGSLVMAGSGWRWCSATQQAAGAIDVGSVKQFAVHSPKPRFYYGIHAWEFLAGLLGSGIQWVELLNEADGYTQFACKHHSGPEGKIHIGGPRQRVIQWIDDAGQHELELQIHDIHQGFCRTFVEMIRTGKMPAPIDQQLEPIRSALLAEQACERGSRQQISELQPDRQVSAQSFMATYEPRTLIPVNV